MTEVIIFGVLALSVLSEAKVIQISENGGVQEDSGYLYTPQRLNAKGDDSLNYGPRDPNVLNQNFINPFEQQIIDGEEKYDSYGQHSDSHSYDYLASKESFLPDSHFNHQIRDRLQITNKIPSLKLDLPYYRAPPKLSKQEYDHVPYGYGYSKNTHEEIVLKNKCTDCDYYNNEYYQNQAHYPHEKSDFNELFTKDVYNPYLPQNPDYYYKKGYSHEEYIDPIEAEKQRLLDKINYIYSNSTENQFNKTTQNSSNPREPLYKSDPHYFHYKPYDDESNYEYRIKSNGLFPYGPKHIDYYPERVNDYYESHDYNHIKAQQESYYGHKDYAPDRYTPNVYSEEIIYPQNRNEYENSNTTNNETDVSRKVYYNPYFDFAPDAKIATGANDTTNSTDLTAQVLRNLLHSKNKYPSSYYPHANDFYNSEHKHFNNIYKHGYSPDSNEHFKDDYDMHYSNQFNPYNIDSSNLYHNERYNYVPKRHFKDVVEDVQALLHTQRKHSPREPYYKDNHVHNNYQHLTDVLNVHANDHYTDPKNIDFYHGQGELHQNYKHFRDIVEEVKRVMQPKNKYNPYDNVHATDFYHSRPRERHYGKLTQPFDKTSVGVLYPYKVRPNPYILPEYRRYQSQNHDDHRIYNHHDI